MTKLKQIFLSVLTAAVAAAPVLPVQAKEGDTKDVTLTIVYENLPVSSEIVKAVEQKDGSYSIPGTVMMDLAKKNGVDATVYPEKDYQVDTYEIFYVDTNDNKSYTIYSPVAEMDGSTVKKQADAALPENYDNLNLQVKLLKTADMEKVTKTFTTPRTLKFANAHGLDLTANGVTLPADVTTYYQAATPLTNPACANDTVVFKNWTDKDGGTDAITSYTWTDDKAVEATVYANYAFQILYQNEDGTTLSSRLANYGETTPDQQAPEVTGKTFKGWDPAVAATVTGPAVYKAVYDLNTYHIIYEADGKEVAAYDVKYGEATPKPEDPQKDGYRFVGWDPAVAATVTEAAEYKAVFEVNTYTVTYKDGNKEIASYNVKNGEATPKPENPQKDGYVFAGWDPAVADTVTGNVTYNAKWNKIYVIRYKANGKDIAVYDQLAGEKTRKPVNDPTLPGYVFKGWSPAVADKVSGDATYTAQFAKVYTIKFMANGKEVASYKQAQGDKTKVPADPTREGYEFQGWNPSVDGTVNGDKTYIATWKKKGADSADKDKDNAGASNGLENGYVASGTYTMNQDGTITYKSDAQAQGDAVKEGKLKITIEYLDAATKKSIKKPVTIELEKGMTYNVTSYGEAKIDGYTHVKTDGKLEGKAEEDTTIKVYYSKETDSDADGSNGEDTKLQAQKDNSGMIAGIMAALGCGLALILALLVINRKREH